VRREAAAATEHEGAAAPRLTIAELRDKVRALGASEGRVRACTERRDLDDLLADLALAVGRISHDQLPLEHQSCLEYR
jgi:hypothetical protein